MSMRSTFFQALSLTLLFVAAGAASNHQEILKEYDINVAAVYQGKGEHVATQCAMYAPGMGDKINQIFLDAGEAQDDKKRRGLRKQGEQGRKLYNCNTYCQMNGYEGEECFYWTQGECGGRRELLAITPDGEYPEEVEDICKRRTQLMRWSLKKAARDVSVSKECKNFFYRRWLFKCVVVKK